MKCSGTGNPLIDALVGFFKFLGDPVGSIIKGIADLIMDGSTQCVESLTTSIPTFSAAASKPVQGQLNWLVVYFAIGSLIFACIRMAAERKGDAGQTALRGMIRLILVAGGSTAIFGAAATVSDDFASKLYKYAIDEQLEKIGCGSSGSIESFLYLILAFLLLLAAIVHGIMLYIRLAVMIVLFGTLPMAAAASMSDWGGGWWRKHIGWMIAWLLYKPAAALVIYAGTDLLTNGEGGDGEMAQVHTKIAGICIMLLSAIALPALLKLVVPATAALGGGNAYGAPAAAIGGGLASGAKTLAGGAMSGGGGGGGSGSGGGGGGGSGGSRSASSPAGASASGGDSGSSGRAGPPGSSGDSGQSSDSSPSGAGSGSGGGSGGGAGGGGGGRGGGGGGGAPTGAAKGAGAAAGPAGLAVEAAVATATGAVQAVNQVVTGTIEGNDGNEGHHPTGGHQHH